MSRPLNVGRRVKELVDGLLRDILGTDVPRKGKPSVDPTRLGKLTQLSRLRADSQTGTIKGFTAVQEGLADMPPA